MVFRLERMPKYEKQLKYLLKYNFHSIFNKSMKIEDILEDGSWLEAEVKVNIK